jgi:hypothetical protein
MSCIFGHTFKKSFGLKPSKYAFVHLKAEQIVSCLIGLILVSSTCLPACYTDFTRPSNNAILIFIKPGSFVKVGKSFQYTFKLKAYTNSPVLAGKTS